MLNIINIQADTCILHCCYTAKI